MNFYCMNCWAEVPESCPHRGDNIQVRRAKADYADKLIAVLRHPEPTTPIRAAWILGERREGKAVEPLFRLIQDSQDHFIFEAAVEALGRIGDECARETLASALSHPSPPRALQGGRRCNVAVTMSLTPIRIIRSPHQRAVGTPIQAALATGAQGTVEVSPEYAPGLRDLDGFERLWLLYWFDRAKPAQLAVKPYLDRVEHGLFATRAPSRPNPIGLSPVRLLRITGNILRVDGLDILDGTPLLDIKPYVPRFDAFQVQRIGWLGEIPSNTCEADDRFEIGGVS
jgi:tRNA-Thr(GGU) m(6)t(6)A37 methyltransferase TsaA